MRWLPAASSAGDVEVAELARDALGWKGFTLPAVQMSGGSVQPVVTWTSAATSRWLDGPNPEPDRATLAEWECHGPATAVRIIGFIHIGTPTATIDRLKAVAGYGPGALVVRSAARIGRWTMAEADMAGLSVVEVNRSSGVHTVMKGRQGPVASARRSVATRLREEQLFEWALRVGHNPQDTPAASRTPVS